MDIQEILNRTDRFAANAGCRITEVDERHAIAEMTVTAEHLNGGHVCQGGALFTLADLAIAALMNHSGQLTFGISNSIMFVSSAKEGDLLRAEAVHVAAQNFFIDNTQNELKDVWTWNARDTSHRADHTSAVWWQEDT